MKRKKPPLKLCARISADDQDRLRLHFTDLATRAANKHGVKVFHIRSPKRYRSHSVCRAREEVVLALRTSVWYRDKGYRSLEIGQRPWFSDTEAPWEPISTPMIAALFPCNHSAIVLLLQRVERRRMAAAEWLKWAPKLRRALKLTPPAVREAAIEMVRAESIAMSDEEIERIVDGVTEVADDRNRNSDSSGRVCGWCDGSDAGQSGAESPERAVEAAT